LAEGQPKRHLGAINRGDTAPGSSMTDAERDRYRELFGRVTLVEVTGGIDFAALVGVVEDLLSGATVC